jgi:putative Mg2+ transporter-C (MgtC) family protein
MGLAEILDGQLWVRVATALFCGGIVGLERQLRGKPAGMRTSSLICLGTMMFIYLGQQMGGPGTDPTRVLGQVVTGIGFLGAGVIMTRDGFLTGVTSAAVVWMLAAVGAAIGLGKLGAAVSMSVVTVCVLVGVEQLEHAFGALRRGVHATENGSAESGSAESGHPHGNDPNQPAGPLRRHRPSGGIERGV